MSAVFRIEVGNAAAGKVGVAKLWSKFFVRNRYRFRISKAPILDDPEPWAGPRKLTVPAESLEYLAFDFPPPAELQAIGENLAASLFEGNFGELFVRSLMKVKGNPLRMMFSYHEDADSLIRRVP